MPKSIPAIAFTKVIIPLLHPITDADLGLKSLVTFITASVAQEVSYVSSDWCQADTPWTCIQNGSGPPSNLIW